MFWPITIWKVPERPGMWPSIAFAIGQNEFVLGEEDGSALLEDLFVDSEELKLGVIVLVHIFTTLVIHLRVWEDLPHNEEVLVDHVSDLCW